MPMERQSCLSTFIASATMLALPSSICGVQRTQRTFLRVTSSSEGNGPLRGTLSNNGRTSLPLSLATIENQLRPRRLASTNFARTSSRVDVCLSQHLSHILALLMTTSVPITFSFLLRRSAVIVVAPRSSIKRLSAPSKALFQALPVEQSW